MKDYNSAAVAAEPPLPLWMAACSSNRERPRLILPPAHSRRRAFSPSQIRIVLRAGADDDCSRNTRLGEKETSGKTSSYPLCLDGKGHSHSKGVTAKLF